MFYYASSLYSYLENDLISGAYFVIILIILFTLSIVISAQYFSLITSEFYLRQFNMDNHVNSSIDQLLFIVKALIAKRLWFKAIQLMEVRFSVSEEMIYKYFNAIGFIYDKMHEYDLAQAYYLKAIDAKSDYVVALQNLAQVYIKKKFYSLALSTYRTVLIYDKENKVAQSFLNKQ